MRPRSLRARITAAGVVALALVLGIGGWVTAATLSASLRADTEAQNNEVLDGLADEITAGADPAALRIPAGADGTEFLILDSAGSIVNVGFAPILFQDVPAVEATAVDSALIDAAALSFESPVVVSSEAELIELLASLEASAAFGVAEFDELTDEELAELGIDPLTLLPDGTAQNVAVGGIITAVGTDQWFETQREVESPTAGDLTLIARSPFAITARSIDRLTTALWIIVPGLVVLGGLAIWWIVGRALRPVRSIADEAGRIAPSNSGDRLPVPASGDELAALTVTLNEMLDRLDDGLVRQRQFVSDASHELRSPLTAVKGAAELVTADSRMPAELAPTANALGNGVRRLEAVLDDLTELADHGGAGDVAAFDLVGLARDVVSDLDVADSVEVRVVGDGAVEIVGNRVRLRRAIENLVRNATAHASSEVVVTVQHEPAPTIVVDDDGPGVPADDRTRVFDRFVRLDDARSRHDGGAGLGLAIVASIAADHDADVRCEESPSGGARFVIGF